MLLQTGSDLRKEHYVLVVEDDPADWDLIQEAVKREQLPVHLLCIHQGENVLAQLKQWRKDDVQQFPELLLLDLELPGQDGREILSSLRREPSLLKLPVIILSASNSPEDILSCYRSGCNCYIQKPDNWNDLHRLMRSIFTYWFDFSELPAFLNEV